MHVCRCLFAIWRIQNFRPCCQLGLCEVEGFHIPGTITISSPCHHPNAVTIHYYLFRILHVHGNIDLKKGALRNLISVYTYRSADRAHTLGKFLLGQCDIVTGPRLVTKSTKSLSHRCSNLDNDFNSKLRVLQNVYNARCIRVAFINYTRKICWLNLKVLLLWFCFVCHVVWSLFLSSCITFVT